MIGKITSGFVAGIVAAGTVFAGIPTAYEGFTKLISLPTCLTYSENYYYVDGFFRLSGGKWTEYQEDGFNEFQEFSRDRQFIYLKNITPRADDHLWRTLMVRLPVCGGTSEVFSRSAPKGWERLFDVVRHPSPGMTAYYEAMAANRR